MGCKCANKTEEEEELSKKALENGNLEKSENKKTNKKFKFFQMIYYNSMQNIVFSDHKPVFAYFNIAIN